MFDKIAVNVMYGPQISDWFHDWEKELDTLDWLEEKGLVRFLNPPYEGLQSYINTDAWSRERNDHEDRMVRELFQFDESGHARRGWRTRGVLIDLDYHTRLCSLKLKATEDCEAIPYSELTTSRGSDESKVMMNNLISVSLKFLPVPDEQTSWEQILEFRSDLDSRQKYLDLRNWLNEMAAGELAPIEVEEKLEYLVSQFERHMAIHKMKIHRSAFETVVVSIAETAEDLVKFKWGKLAQAVFALRRKKAELLEAELTAPGSSIAYIHKTNNTFKN